MKKAFKGLSALFMALVLVLAVTACSNNTEKKDENKTETSKNKEEKVDKTALGGDLSTFAYDIQVAISNADAPFGTLGSYAEAEGDAYNAQDVKDAASQVQTLLLPLTT
ncbi:hypothetical protein [Tuberibacillus calidus]|uniref:hypothetical protein n=1 Tax=Tuberibacillus calidus TaxID=340097 RepID=UPI0003FFEB6F|nr:hypothetical protein [Tuberibacillus calidus]